MFSPVLGTDRLDFLVMGDWGGIWYAPWATPQERETAKGMQKIGDRLAASFSLALGDNFYSDGVENVESKRFKLTFEDVFTNQFPFHVIAGNHDHYGNISAQVAYTGVSKRWSYPSLYYTFMERAGDKEVQFVMLDTVMLAGQSQVKDPSGGADKDLRGVDLPGPENKADAESQLKWLEDTLKASTADYLIVAGHYPIYSVGEHGGTPYLDKHVKPLLLKHNVSAYVNGHDHCAEHIDVGDGIQYHVVGSAHENDDDKSNKHSIPKGALKFYKGDGNGGFASVSVADGTMVFKHYNGNGDLLYTAPGISPRR